MRLFPSIMLTLTVALIGCEAPGVGDPCVPEAIPEGGGFNALEKYLETSSVQCRTRVCMVYEFSGDPSESREECETRLGGPNVECDALPSQADIEQRVYCTCRCDTTTQGASTCECPEGFACVPILDDPESPGITGSYCVRDDTPGLPPPS
jgi:hypothetical protein